MTEPDPKLSDLLAIGPGCELNGYRVEAILGRGGMGVVFRARQTALGGRPVALKIVRPDLAHDARTRERFEREVQLAARIEHPNICAVLDIGWYGSCPYLVMQLVEGEPLDRILARARAAWTRGSAPSDPFATEGKRWLRSAEVVERLARAVDAAHRHGLVHRDIKPGNVILRTDGEPVLLDFGLARDPSQEADLTSSGDRLGTPAYMAPEQVAGLSVDARADVHALGVLLFECLTLRLPREAARCDEMLGALRRDLPADPRRYASDLPADLCSVLCVALEPDPAHRYATAAALAEDLRRVIQGESVLARPPGFVRRARRWLRRHRVAATIVVLLAAGVTGTSTGFVQATERAHEISRRKEEIATQKAVIERRTSEFDLLANVVRLRTAQQREAVLHPPWPPVVAQIEAWLADDAARLGTALPQLRQTVESLRERTQDEHGNEAERDARRLLLETLTRLITDIETFEKTTVADVRERLAWARQIGELTRAHPRARVTWADARAAIAAADGVVASDLYREHPIDLVPQTGLVPIGMNPRTKLWEFYHLRSAWDGQGAPRALEVPRHDASGHIAVADDTGIVFVLLPGGTFTMGAQAQDPTGPNYDRAARGFEGPPHKITLAPFFLARHELTQGQWQRLAGRRLPRAPSLYRPGGRLPHGVNATITLAHPVTHVSQAMCVALLATAGLVLPTDAQWEYGCRAGTRTPWWTGTHAADLQGYANLLDQSAKAHVLSRMGGSGADIADWDDGHAVHAPVDALRSNAWGLHHVAGNVPERVQDLAGDYTFPVRAGDGLRRVTPGRIVRDLPADKRQSRHPHVIRNGGCYLAAEHLRSAFRFPGDSSSTGFVGLRAARGLTR